MCTPQEIRRPFRSGRIQSWSLHRYLLATDSNQHIFPPSPLSRRVGLAGNNRFFTLTHPGHHFSLAFFSSMNLYLFVHQCRVKTRGDSYSFWCPWNWLNQHLCQCIHLQDFKSQFQTLGSHPTYASRRKKHLQPINSTHTPPRNYMWTLPSKKRRTTNPTWHSGDKNNVLVMFGKVW